MLFLLAEIVDHKIVLKNGTFCAPGTAMQQLGNISICIPIACDSVDVAVCAQDACYTGDALKLTTCTACQKADYFPDSKSYGLCAYKCLRNAFMKDCFYLLGDYYCNGDIELKTDDPNVTETVNVYCYVCPNGYTPSETALACEKIANVNGNTVIGCLAYSEITTTLERADDGADSQLICTDCGIANCSYCVNGTAEDSLVVPQCKYCKTGYPLYGYCASGVPGCAKYEKGTLKCAECAAGYALYRRSDGFPVCITANYNCKGVGNTNETCVLTIDASGIERYRYVCLGATRADGGCLKCDCAHLTEECVEYCGWCQSGFVYSSTQRKCVYQAGSFSIKYCQTLNGSRCAYCMLGFQLIDDGHSCARSVTKCGKNQVVSGGISCVCEVNYTRNDILECVLRPEACGLHGVLQNGACVCDKGFSGEFCSFCSNGRVLQHGKCYNYISAMYAWWGIFALLWAAFATATIVLWIRGWFRGLCLFSTKQQNDNVADLKGKRGKDRSMSAQSRLLDANQSGGLRVVF